MDDDPYTYVFGIQGTEVLLARTPFHDLDGAWEYRTADGWSGEPTEATTVLSGVATQLSVLRDGDGWLLVSQDPFPGRGVNLWRGAEPWQWSDAETLVTLPAVAGGQTYNALVHEPMTSAGGLLLSYNVIADDPAAGMADASLYRPRFVRVDLPAP